MMIASSGPDLHSFCDGLVDTGLSRIPPKDDAARTRPRFHGSIQAHFDLLQIGRSVLQSIADDPRIKDAASPTLFHHDLNTRNIFVLENDPTVITAIIDWQSCSIQPAFWYADDKPDFISHPDTDVFEKAYKVSTDYHLPKLTLPKSMEPSLFRPFHYCHKTWKNGIAGFQWVLIETAHLWKQLGLTGPCPYRLPGADELSAHSTDHELYQESLKLRDAVARYLEIEDDGWVAPEEWEEKRQSQVELFYELTKDIGVLKQYDLKHIKSEADLRQFWPFALGIQSTRQ
jgi:hypothetical protein